MTIATISYHGCRWSPPAQASCRQIFHAFWKLPLGRGLEVTSFDIASIIEYINMHTYFIMYDNMYTYIYISHVYKIYTCTCAYQSLIDISNWCMIYVGYVGRSFTCIHVFPWRGGTRGPFFSYYQYQGLGQEGRLEPLRYSPYFCDKKSRPEGRHGKSLW